MLETRALGEFAIVLTHQDGLKAFGENHGAIKENVLPVKNMKNALENLMVLVLAMEPGVGREREIQDVQPYLVKLPND